MKIPSPFRLNKVSALAALAAAAIGLSVTPAHATNYSGNGNAGFSGAVGNGILTLTDDGTNIYGKLTTDAAMDDCLVIYVDTGAGGFTNTLNFSDANDGSRQAISGYSGSQRSEMTFTNGFTPKYAIALGPNDNNFGGLWQLADGGNNSLPYLTSVNLTPTGTNIGPYTFSFAATNLGLTVGGTATIKIFGTYISDTGYRSTEAIAGNDSGTEGYFPFTQTGYGTYTFAVPAPPTYPVTFSVDMSNEVVLKNFNPANGDTVYCGGTFQTNPFSELSFQLTNNVHGANSNLYSGTYLDLNPTNTAEQFKFAFNSVVSNSLVYDDDLNRVFVLKSGGQVLPEVYFNDVFPKPSAMTNYLTVSINMGPEIYTGNFNPSTMQVEALGTFESPKWTAGFILTNNPSLSGYASNTYSGTIADGNYPGTFEQYKFVITNTIALTLTYENGNNRTFYTPTNAGALPLAYFNDISTNTLTPVTFSVDMTVPIPQLTFNPQNGDTVGCAGTFQTNSFTVGAAGFILTNNPTAANSNVYSGTYLDQNVTGSGEEYKFVINTNGGGTDYEEPASTGGGNRSFVLNAAGVTNPLVFWNDQNTNTILLVPTTITFTVNMTNAVDIYGNPFDPNNDLVMVDGDFYSPPWQVLSDATDPMIANDYSANLLYNNPSGSTLYTATFVVPAGNSLQVNYKYGIDHSSSGPNTNVDNEAGYGQNHVRYIRAEGTYNFPTDIFGQQVTDPAAADEPLFGDLATSPVTGGKLPITWLGGIYNVQLQTSTNLLGAWQNVNGTTGMESTNWPTSAAGRYFRLVKP